MAVAQPLKPFARERRDEDGLLYARGRTLRLSPFRLVIGFIAFRFHEAAFRIAA